MVFGNFNDIRIFLKPGATDMRKAINGLSCIAQESIEDDLCSGNLYVFCNKRRNNMKILYYHVNSFCLWQKRLSDRDKFRWPKTCNDNVEITKEQLLWLLRGLDFSSAHKSKRYTKFI
jgi:transposase